VNNSGSAITIKKSNITAGSGAFNSSNVV